jgi:molybdate transport system substrate-binding protein
MAALALVAGFALVGCTQEAPKTEDKPAEQTNTPPPAEESHDPVELQIFAANSLTKAMADVQALYQEDHSWVTFKDTQYKSSGELNELLAAGSYADILISASKGKMDDADKAGYIDPATRFDMFRNDLVIVTSSSSTISDVTLADVAAGKYTVAVGDESVPAGNYACQALNTVGCYSDASGIGGTFTGALAEEGKVVLDTSVGNVCKKAQSGDVDIAFVYTSDVYRFEGVKIVGTVAESAHKPIIYPAAVCKDSKFSQDAQDFLDWAISDPKALAAWQKWGFELVG